MLSRERLAELLGRFPQLTIGLLGDLFLDRYLEIDAALEEFSLETGLAAHQVTAIRNSPGALGTVMSNLAALGVGRLVPISVIGDDGHARDLVTELRRLPVELAHLLHDRERLTPTYTKPMRREANGVWRELNRLDVRSRQPLSPATLQRTLVALETVWSTADGLIVLDQVPEAWLGVVSPPIRERLAHLRAMTPSKLMFVDSRMHVHCFSAGVLKPNRAECLQGAGLADSATHAELEEAVAAWAGRTGSPVFCTLGADGILLAEPGAAPYHVPGAPAEGPIDVVGAGDSATAGIVAARLAGATWLEAAVVGNLVASITVEQLGTTGTATPQQVLDRWGRFAMR